jgi:hypothetical protein
LFATVRKQFFSLPVDMQHLFAVLAAAAAAAAAPKAAPEHFAAEQLPPFGSVWARSDAAKANLTVVDGSLRWTKPEKPTVVMTSLPADEAGSVAEPGDSFSLRFQWRSDGGNVRELWRLLTTVIVRE